MHTGLLLRKNETKYFRTRRRYRDREINSGRKISWCQEALPEAKVIYSQWNGDGIYGNLIQKRNEWRYLIQKRNGTKIPGLDTRAPWAEAATTYKMIIISNCPFQTWPSPGLVVGRASHNLPVHVAVSLLRRTAGRSLRVLRVVMQPAPQ